MGPPSFPALQSAHGMDRKARNRRELLLRESPQPREELSVARQMTLGRRLSWTFHFNAAERARPAVREYPSGHGD
jgi:hypothetical protein